MAGAGTGRIAKTVSERTRRLLYGGSWDDTVAELGRMVHIDLAHLAMLRRQGLVESDEAGRLAAGIGVLRADGFAPLRDAPAPRGLYLLYEGHLAERLGEAVSGRLHTGRSRNDMGATSTSLRLRATLLDLVTETARLQAILLAGARRHRSVVMPVYTHYQPAMPGTYGHYLLGVALALGRAATTARHAADAARRCPMGACAVAGTDLPIDPETTARLLGFDGGPLHALDAVASRDTVLQALSAATGIGLVVGRLATDLQLWSTQEFGLVGFGDRLVGGSSAMPQKRNAFILEHLKAAAGTAMGAWTAVAGMTKSTPFTNTIEVGTGAVSAAWPGFEAIGRAVRLAQAVVSGADPVPARMAERARNGFTQATALANQLVRQGVPFRLAHEAVGSAVREAVDAGSTSIREVDTERLGVDPHAETAARAHGLDEAVAAMSAGGGPGAFDEGFAAARADVAAHAAWRDGLATRVAAPERTAAAVLAAAAAGRDIAAVPDELAADDA